MAKAKFKLQQIDTISKAIFLRGPDGLEIAIDYDDVDHKAIRKAARKMKAILHRHWDDDKKKPKP